MFSKDQKITKLSEIKYYIRQSLISCKNRMRKILY